MAISTKRKGRIKGKRGEHLRLYTAIAIVVGLLVAYGAYSVLVPVQLQVPKLSASSTNNALMIVTIYNPSGKFVSGSLLSIQTEVDLRESNTNQTTILQSVPETYTLLLAPFSTQQLGVTMNSHIVPTVYDFLFQVNGQGQQTVSVNLAQ